MGEQVISASGTQYGLIINSDGSINIGGITGSIVIGSVSANVDNIYVSSGNTFIQSGVNIVGSMFQMEGIPTSSIYNNPRLVLAYSGTVIGSVYQFIGTGSYVQVLSYTGNNLTGVSSWSVV